MLFFEECKRSAHPMNGCKVAGCVQKEVLVNTCTQEKMEVFHTHAFLSWHTAAGYWSPITDERERQAHQSSQLYTCFTKYLHVCKTKHGIPKHFV